MIIPNISENSIARIYLTIPKDLFHLYEHIISKKNLTAMIKSGTESASFWLEAKIECGDYNGLWIKGKSLYNTQEIILSYFPDKLISAVHIIVRLPDAKEPFKVGFRPPDTATISLISAEK